MKICYFDESGTAEEVTNENSVSMLPVFCTLGLIIDNKDVRQFTKDFMTLKGQYFPNKFKDIAPRKEKGVLNFPNNMAYNVNYITRETKGEDIRKRIRKGDERKARQTQGFIDKIFELLEKHKAKLIGTVVVKAYNDRDRQKNSYQTSVQFIAEFFNHYLTEEKAAGMIIADSRRHHSNCNVSHSIFTQMYRKSGGDPYRYIADAPVYGGSENFAGIQVCDILVSAVMMPMAISRFCQNYYKSPSPHFSARYDNIANRYSDLVQSLLYKKQKNGQFVGGGIKATDYFGHRSSHELFVKPARTG